MQISKELLLSYNLSTDGTVPTLRHRLSEHLSQLEASTTQNVMQTDVQLSKPTALCMASNDVLLIAHDGLRVIQQILLERNGVTIRGQFMKTLAKYPTNVKCIESMTVSDSILYFVGAKNPNCSGGLYKLSMETTTIDIVLKNSTRSCGEIKKVSRNESNGALVFTDVEARNVKSFDPITLEITHLAGDGNSIDLDGTGLNCSFIQVMGICCIANTIFVTDAAAGKVKMMVGLAGTCEFLLHMGILYNSFSIGCKGSPSMKITPENVVSNVKQVHQYIQSTINKVKESKQLKKEASTNGPEGTVSVKTQV